MKSTAVDNPRRLVNLRFFLGVVILACLLGFQSQAYEAGGLMLWRRTVPKIYTLPLAGLGGLTALLLLLTYTRFQSVLQSIAKSVQHFLVALHWFNLLVFLAMGILFPCLYLTTLGKQVWPYAPRIWVFLLIVAAGSLFRQAAVRGGGSCPTATSCLGA